MLKLDKTVATMIELNIKFLRPYHPSILAVGCANCIIIWDIDAIPVSIKPSSTCSYTLSHLYHNDIIDLQWDSKTDYLYSFATKDNQIMVSVK